MTTDDHSDFPQWICDIIGREQRCPKCQRALMFADLTCIGASYPGIPHVTNLGPQAKLIFQCSKCYQMTAFDVAIEKTTLLSAVESLIDIIEGERDATDETSPALWLPSPNHPTSKEDNPGCDGTCHGSGDRHNDGSDPSEEENISEIERAFRARQSYYSKMLSQMPKDREVNAFLNRLKQTSWRRNTKSFHKFMTDLGIDMDQQGKPNDDAATGNDDEGSP